VDGKQFDALSRKLATENTRRGVLKTLAATVVIGAAAVIGRDGANAAPIPPGFCSTEGQACSNNSAKRWGCCKGLTCKDGSCQLKTKGPR
jgi:hypothetical protein